MLKNEIIHNHKLTNLFYTVIYLLSMGAVLGFTAYLIAGNEGLFWMAVFTLIFLVINVFSPVSLQLRMYGARKLNYYDSPQLFDMVKNLALKADLPKMPKLYLVSSNTLNAFAVGSKENPHIGLTRKILSVLDFREVQGVLAHEISHLKSNDTQMMFIAQMFNRMTANVSFIGKILLFINLPLILLGEVYISWMAIVLLIMAPYISKLLTLALSRTREFEADLGAAELTQDPDGLANALQKLDFYQKQNQLSWWNNQRVIEIPGIWRSHPIAQKRIEKLRSLVNRYQKNPFVLDSFYRY